MGNANQKDHVDISNILKTNKLSPKTMRQRLSRSRGSKLTASLKTPYDIMTNISLMDCGYERVQIIIGTQTFNGVLNDGEWTFATHLPMFKIPDDCECKIFIYPKTTLDSHQPDVQTLDLSFDAVERLSQNELEQYSSKSLVCGKVIYRENNVF